jgi:sec-independent protein translocase protein TatB
MGTPLPIEAATIGWSDSLILMLMALVVFGPRKLPQLGRQIGKLMYEFRKASNDFKFQMEEEMRAAEEADRRKKEEAERAQQQALNPPAAESAATAPAETPAENTDDANNPYLGYTEYVKEQERQAEEAALTVQPPSTGEPVPAGSGSGAAPSETVAQTPAVLNTSALPTVESPLAPTRDDAAQAELNTAPEANPTSETTPHHG